MCRYASQATQNDFIQTTITFFLFTCEINMGLQDILAIFSSRARYPNHLSIVTSLSPLLPDPFGKNLNDLPSHTHTPYLRCSHPIQLILSGKSAYLNICNVIPTPQFFPLPSHSSYPLPPAPYQTRMTQHLFSIFSPDL